MSAAVRWMGLGMAAALWAGTVMAEPAVIPESALPTVQELQRKALAGAGAYELVESLTTEVGARLPGTPGDAAGVKWAVAKLKELGFDKVWTEPVQVDGWIRGKETASVKAPFPQPLQITALGHTAPTPPGGLEADIAFFPTLDALKAAPDGSLKGKIAYVGQRTIRAQDGAGYGESVGMRVQGASEAARKGAAGLLIRSVGTDSHRFPHTGVMRYHEDDKARIPAAALSAPDADLIERMLQRGKPVRVHMELTPEFPGPVTSHNVIGEIRGSEAPEEIVLIGAHLDSWDLGTGALDDGAGVAIVTAAAKLIKELPKAPRRTVRVVLFAAEEVGLVGAKAYAAAHAAELDKHVVAMEADFGAGPVWRFDTRFAEEALPAGELIHRALLPLGVTRGHNQATGGPDIGPLVAAGVPAATLYMDGTDYFDFHHTSDDTLDKVDAGKLNQSVAAYATFVWLAAQAKGEFRGKTVQAH